MLMKAVVPKPDHSGDLEIREVPKPEPGGGEIRVRVRASGINRADLMQAKGNYPAPAGAPADILGLEFAGEVESLGPNTTGLWNVGDRVFGIVGGGGMAEYLVLPERQAVAIPPNLDFEQAAAVPEVFITAHDALVHQGRLQAGERVLIHAVGGGVGSAAVQIARAMGCVVFGTSRTDWKLDKARVLGVDVPINTREQETASIVREHTNGQGVHVLIDFLGGSAMSSNLDAMAEQGRLVVVGLLTGPKAEVNLRMLMSKRLSLVGTVLRARPLEEKIAATHRFAETVVPWLASERVRPVLDQVFPLNEVQAAQQRMASNEGFGKIVLQIA
ncbi:MAG TPA: NAD(P)H-quinone oxidoreductase [Isosphaeraceae bacterium]|nr:NAD(P)H-quinone oxidoreductase [Isosphaeraceae bacterium]